MENPLILCIHRNLESPLFNKRSMKEDGTTKVVLTGDKCVICMALGMRYGLVQHRTGVHADFGREASVKESRGGSHSRSRSSSRSSIASSTGPLPPSSTSMLSSEGFPHSTSVSTMGLSTPKPIPIDVLLPSISQSQCTFVPSTSPVPPLRSLVSTVTTQPPSEQESSLSSSSSTVPVQNHSTSPPTSMSSSTLVSALSLSTPPQSSFSTTSTLSLGLPISTSTPTSGPPFPSSQTAPSQKKIDLAPKKRQSTKLTSVAPTLYPNPSEMIRTMGVQENWFEKGLKLYQEQSRPDQIPDTQIPVFDTDQGRGIKPYHKLDAQQWRFRFDIKDGENGETYHGLIGAIITNTFLVSKAGKEMEEYMKQERENFIQKRSETFRGRWKIPDWQRPFPTLFHLTASSANQRQLLAYYLHRDQLREPISFRWREQDIRDDPIISRPAVTQQIAEFFRQNPLPKQQEAIHRALVNVLDDQNVAQSLGNFKYITPSYLAKFFINRYLQATWNQKLPKASEIGRIAFIVVRRGATTEDPTGGATARDPRRMDRVNLHRCLDAIHRANKLACAISTSSITEGTRKKLPEQRFTHAIIYGDIGFHEVQELMKSNDGFQIIGLSAPFHKDPENIGGSAVWSSFKSKGLEWYAPQEVMWLGIFMALKARYGAYISFIGFRSGSLDVPGLLGLPIFSLDNQVAEYARSEYYSNERETILRQKQDEILRSMKSEHDNKDKTGGPLSDKTPASSIGRSKSMKEKSKPDKGARRIEGDLEDGDRLAIRPRAFAHGNSIWEKHFSRGQYLWNIDSYGSGGPRGQMERMEEMSRRLNTFITINLPLIYGPEDDPTEEEGEATSQNMFIRLTRQSQDHLSAALAIYALQDDGDAPRWKKRITLMEYRPAAIELMEKFWDAFKILEEMDQVPSSTLNIQPPPSTLNIQPPPSTLDIQPLPPTLDIQPLSPTLGIQPLPSALDIQTPPPTLERQITI